ncbi:MAG: hypothetical protein IPI97_08215 [Nitrosomonas sp.]|nr:hypothetical protein [Nitrosomonas sp.]
MTEPQKMPELLTDLASRAQKILAEKTGMETSLAEHVGFEIAREMAENWGGQSIYVPKGHEMQLHSRDEQVWDDFDGHNHNQLAAKYKISVQWVYTIVKRMRASKFRKMQIGLFDQINTQQPKE